MSLDKELGLLYKDYYQEKVYSLLLIDSLLEFIIFRFIKIHINILYNKGI